MSRDSSGIGPVLKTVRLLLILAFIVLGAQLYLNKPGDRPEVACYPAYLAYKFTIVDIPHLVLPRAHKLRLAAIENTEWMHDRCVHYTHYIPGFGGHVFP